MRLEFWVFTDAFHVGPPERTFVLEVIRSELLTPRLRVCHGEKLIPEGSTVNVEKSYFVGTHEVLAFTSFCNP